MDAGAARTTIRRWDARREAHDRPAAEVEFFESPEGVECLRRIMTALEFVIGLLSPGGIRLVCMFLRLSGLDAFVGASVGGVQNRMTALEDLVVQFGREQRASLASRMSPKEITVCEDETFHPKICLVAIEAASNFILVEEYADDRTAETWNAATQRGLADLPVKVIQATGDEAKALAAHAEDIDAHHSPDVFHVQREASRAISLPLQRRVVQANDALEAAMTATEQAIADRAAYEEAKQNRGPGRPPNFDGRIEATRAAEKQVTAMLEQALADRDEARAAIAGISTDYHPYDLSDGSPQNPEAVATKIGARIGALESIAARAGLSERTVKGLAKAKRVVPGMVDTIRFVHQQTTSRLAALAISLDQREKVANHMVPAMYLQAVARRAPTAAERQPIMATAGLLSQQLLTPDHVLQGLPEELRSLIEATAADCAQLFQRSSSCVEGRNGHLALHHHGLHKLSPRKLGALTVVHNYFTTRPDGTTAAERFFESEHEDLFEYVLTKMPLPPRPRHLQGRGSNDEPPRTAWAPEVKA